MRPKRLAPNPAPQPTTLDDRFIAHPPATMTPEEERRFLESLATVPATQQRPKR